LPFDYTVPAPFTHTSEAVRAWVHGWAVSRGAAVPSSRPWGFTVEIGLPGHAMSHVLPSPDERTVREITGRATGPGVWLKALVPPTTLAPWLAPGWSLPGGPGALMSTPLSVTPGHIGPALPRGYQLHTRTGAGVTRAVVHSPDGARAARGRIAVTGSAAVVDQVETGPAHRRRGLGRLIMHTLTAAAAGQGATAGVLAATPEGRALYETTGWVVLAPLASAVRGPDPVETRP